MKHLMRYEGYTSVERADDILDKISKYGIKSLTQLEKEFLDSHKLGHEEELHVKLAEYENETTFVDDNGNFKFEFLNCEEYGGEKHYTGVLYVPDLILKSGKRIQGILGGKIIVYENGGISPEFYSVSKDPITHENYEIFDFCEGLEYELDSFLDYVVDELEDKN